MSRTPEMHIDKNDLTEEEIKIRFINPAVFRTWSENNVRMEYYITDGRIIIDGKKTHRSKRGEADYVLFHYGKGNWFPIAVIEAKDNNSSVIGGMGQARQYAKAMNVPFAFSSNGDYFALYDDLTGHETPVSEYIPMDEFPSPDDLWKKYKAESGMSDEAEELLSVPYYFRAGKRYTCKYYWGFYWKKRPCSRRF